MLNLLEISIFPLLLNILESQSQSGYIFSRWIALWQFAPISAIVFLKNNVTDILYLEHGVYF